MPKSRYDGASVASIDQVCEESDCSFGQVGWLDTVLLPGFHAGMQRNNKDRTREPVYTQNGFMPCSDVHHNWTERSSKMVWVPEGSLGLSQVASCVTGSMIPSLRWYCDGIVASCGCSRNRW